MAPITPVSIIDASRRPARPASLCGFTLVELMVVVAIVAILLAVGVPYFGDTIARNDNRAVSLSIRGAVDLTRSEAIRRGATAKLCATTDADATPPSCLTGAGNKEWSGGWIGWFDTDNDDVIDASEEFFLRQSAPSPAVSGQTAARTQANSGVLAFGPLGTRVAPGSSGTANPAPMAFCTSNRANVTGTGRFPLCLTVGAAGQITSTNASCAAPAC